MCVTEVLFTSEPTLETLVFLKLIVEKLYFYKDISVVVKSAVVSMPGHKPAL